MVSQYGFLVGVVAYFKELYRHSSGDIEEKEGRTSPG
jgi:hypothetical protein